MTQITIDPATAQQAASLCALVTAGDIEAALNLTDHDPLPVITALLMAQTLAGSLSTDSREFDWPRITDAFRAMTLDVESFL